MKKDQQLQYIENQRHELNLLLSGKSFKRIESLGFILPAIQHETLILFQCPKNELKENENPFCGANMVQGWRYIVSPENRKAPITTGEIQYLHNIISNNLDIAGYRYRTDDIVFQQTQMHAPSPSKVPDMMETLALDIQDYYKSTYKTAYKYTDAFQMAVDVHYRLIEMQPFEDCNKRTARLLMNWILIQNNYTPILFNKQSDKGEYMKNLSAYGRGDIKTYKKYMYKCMLRTQKFILQQLSQHRQ